MTINSRFYLRISLVIFCFSLWSLNSFTKTKAQTVHLKSEKTIQECRPYDYLDQNNKAKCQLSTPTETIENDKISNQEILIQRRKIKTAIKDIVGAINFENSFPELKNAEKQNHLDEAFWQNFINQTLSTVFSLESLSNAQIFCTTIPLEVDQFGLQFGINSRQIAQSLHNQCLAVNPNAIKSFFGNQIFMKEYIFVKTETSFPYSGWTDQSNTTYLFVNTKTTWGDLSLAIIHEIAIALDSKMNQGLYDFLAKNPEAESSYSDASAEWKKLFEIARLPEIAYIFATMRANRIMLLGLNDISSLNQEQNSSNIKNEFNNLFKKTSTWSFPTGGGNIVAAYHNDIIKKLRFTYPDLNAALDMILNSSTKIALSKDGPEIDFITYMATPQIGTMSRETTRNNGPGCGYCGTSLSPQTIQKWNTKWHDHFIHMITRTHNE